MVKTILYRFKGEFMKKYKVREYINKLKEDNEIESLNMCDDILDIEINYMTYNSNNVDFDTMFICKGDNFKEEYLNSAIKNGAIVYVSEKKYNVNIPGIIVKILETLYHFYQICILIFQKNI